MQENPLSIYERMSTRAVGRPSMDATCLRVDDAEALKEVLWYIRRPKFYKYFPFNNSDPDLLPRIKESIRSAGFTNDEAPSSEVTFEGTDASSLRFPIAVKLIYHDRSCDATWMEMAMYNHFRKRFDSRYVPKYYGTTLFSFDHPDRPGKVHHYRSVTLMEFLEGFEPTGLRMERGPLSPLESAMLEEAHHELWGMGAMHADLHPHNIMVKVNPMNDRVIDVRVIDFNRSIFLPSRVPSANDRAWLVRTLPKALAGHLPATALAILKQKPELIFDFRGYAGVTARRVDDVTIRWYAPGTRGPIPTWFTDYRSRIRSIRKQMQAVFQEGYARPRSEYAGLPCEIGLVHMTRIAAKEDFARLLAAKKDLENALWSRSAAQEVTKNLA